MPYIFHPDERFMISRGVYFFSGDFNPHLFIYPSFLMYILFFVDGVVYLVGSLMGHFDSLSQFTELYHTDPALFYIPNRLVIAAFAILSIYATFVLARFTFGKKTAFLSIILMALLPVHVLHSHFVTTDVPCILFVVLSFYYSIKIIQSGKVKHYVLAAVFGGLAAGIKYNGGAVVLCMIVAHALREWEFTQGGLVQRFFSLLKRMFMPKLVLPCFLSIVVFVLTSPYTVLDFQGFIKDFLFQIRVQRRGHGLIFLGIENKLFYELFVVFRNWGGSFLWMTMLAGVVRAVFKLDKIRSLYLFWLGFYFMALVTSNDFFIRYTLLLVPFLLILVADVLISGIQNSKPVLKYTTWILTVVTIAFMGYYSTVIATSLASEDPRITAKHWFENNVEPGATVGMMTSSTGMQQRDDPPINPDNYDIFTSKSISEIIKQQPEYVLISRYDYIDYIRVGEKSEFTRDSFNILQKLRSGETEYERINVFDNSPTLFGSNLLGTFPIHDMMYTFPRIEIYKLTSD